VSFCKGASFDSTDGSSFYVVVLYVSRMLCKPYCSVCGERNWATAKAPVAPVAPNRPLKRFSHPFFFKRAKVSS